MKDIVTIRRFSVAVAAILFITLLVAAQATGPMGFGAIPPEHVGLLQARLTLLVEAERTQDWDALYDLLDKKDYLAETTRDTFIRARQDQSASGRSTIVSFQPYASRPDPMGFANRFELTGCAETIWKGKTHHWESSVDAYLEDGQWYFGEIMTQFSAVDGPPIECDTKPTAMTNHDDTQQAIATERAQRRLVGASTMIARAR